MIMAEANKTKLKKNHKIILHNHKDDIAIDVDLLKKYSNKIKQLDLENKVPKTLDLSDYDVTAVATLINYIATDGHNKARITNSILGDMIEIASALEMESLLKKIEEFILTSITQSEHFLVHMLTMISMQMLTDTTLGKKVTDIAVAKFLTIMKISTFNEIPLDIILRILDRCDLNINNEYNVVEAAISWLAAKPERIYSSYLVLRCIRIVNLTPKQRLDLFDLIDTVPHYSQIMSAFAHYTFNNTNAHRICVLGEHNSYKRCGNKTGQTEFVIDVPSRKIVYRRKSPVKASYVTAKPKSAVSQTTSEKKGDQFGDGKDIKRSVFTISHERRTTRAERMARYADEYKREQKQNTTSKLSKLTKEKESTESKKEIGETKTSKDGNKKTTKSNTSKQSKKQHKTTGSSSGDSSTYFESSDNRIISTSDKSSSENDSSNETYQSTPSASISTDESRESKKK
uniref:BACK domain-containing protein n=1 Tax=Onchocerca volvulus TaxID=6282 RepID=A0A8R1TPG7_ONCVO